jgi:hypothetical protein
MVFFFKKKIFHVHFDVSNIKQLINKYFANEHCRKMSASARTMPTLIQSEIIFSDLDNNFPLILGCVIAGL